MPEFLVRWKFAANSLINTLDHDSHWYQQFHNDREDAEKHYFSLLKESARYSMTVKIYRLSELVSSEENSNELIVKKRSRASIRSYASKREREQRLERIKEMHEAGYSKSEIAATFGITSEYVRQIMHKNNLLV